MELRPIEGASFGAEIHGVDLRLDLSDETIGSILNALYEHRAIVIKDQDLNEQEYIAFGRKIGTPDPHPLEHLRLAGHPEIEAIGNTKERDKDAAIRNGAAFWHSDQCYEQNPASVIIVYAIKVPDEGGETLVADMRGAYDALDQATKDRIEGLVARHCYDSAGGQYGDTKAPPLKSKQQQDKMATVRHYLALPHPVTGEKSLYAPTGFTTGIDKVDGDEASDLFQRLKEHALSDRFILTRKHEVGDITLMDQFQTLHKAVSIGLPTGDHDQRLLWRIGIKNGPDMLKDRWKLDQPACI